jgi:hypothetical protein
MAMESGFVLGKAVGEAVAAAALEGRALRDPSVALELYKALRSKRAEMSVSASATDTSWILTHGPLWNTLKDWYTSRMHKGGAITPFIKQYERQLLAACPVPVHHTRCTVPLS